VTLQRRTQFADSTRSVASAVEIERVISELQAMRSSFRTEGDRVERATTNCAGMSQAAMFSMRIIADGLSYVRKEVWLDPALLRLQAILS
jgi:hypothetical protein